MNNCKCLLIVFGVIGLVLLTAGCILGFLVLGDLIRDEVVKQVRLEDGSIQYERWKELPFPITFKAYIFNVTNPVEILNGEKPVVKEVGPYIYKQYRKKYNIERNETEDTLFYYQSQIYYFDANESAPLTQEDTLTVFFAPVNAILQMLESFPLPDWESAFPDQSIFSEIVVGQYLFDGYKFCTENAGLTCTLTRAVSGEVKPIELIDDNENENLKSLSFAFLKFKNNTHDGSYKIIAGMKKVKDVGLIQQWENDTVLYNTWFKEGNCSMITGRDSTIYPPDIKKQDSFDIFSTDICRVASIEYVEDEEYMGITGERREMKRDTFANTEENECYCNPRSISVTVPLNRTADCFPDGFMDLYTCLKAPIVLSLPHFLWGDEEYKATVDGLEPNEEDHITYVVMEPGTGVPLKGTRRVQFNMMLRPINNINVLQNVQPAIMPLLWIEESVEITEEFVNELKSKYLNMLVIVDVVTWVLIGLGIAMFVISTAFFIKLSC